MDADTKPTRPLTGLVDHQDVALVLGYTPAHLRKMARNPSVGLPPLIQLSARRYVMEGEAVEAWIDQRRAEAIERQGGSR